MSFRILNLFLFSLIAAGISLSVPNETPAAEGTELVKSACKRKCTGRRCITIPFGGKKCFGGECNTKCVDCKVFGCTCQGLSNKFGTDAGKTWGSAQELVRQWWVLNNCNTRPNCQAFGCSCQGLSNKYGTHHNVSWGSAPQIFRDWWVKNNCNTAPICERFGQVCKAVGRRCSGWGPWKKCRTVNECAPQCVKWKGRGANLNMMQQQQQQQQSQQQIAGLENAGLAAASAALNYNEYLIGGAMIGVGLIGSIGTYFYKKQTQQSHLLLSQEEHEALL